MLIVHHKLSIPQSVYICEIMIVLRCACCWIQNAMFRCLIAPLTCQCSFYQADRSVALMFGFVLPLLQDWTQQIIFPDMWYVTFAPAVSNIFWLGEGPMYCIISLLLLSGPGDIIESFL